VPILVLWVFGAVENMLAAKCLGVESLQSKCKQLVRISAPIGQRESIREPGSTTPAEQYKKPECFTGNPLFQ